MGDVEVHDQLGAGAQIGLGGGDEQIVGACSAWPTRAAPSAASTSMRTSVPTSGRCTRTSGSRCASRTPAGPGTATRRARPPTCRASRRRCGRGSSRAGRARTSAARSNRPGRANATPTRGRSASASGTTHGVAVLDATVVGDAAVDSGARRARRPACRSTPACCQRFNAWPPTRMRSRQLGHQLEPVVVGRRPPQRQLDRRTQQVVDRRRRASLARDRPRRDRLGRRAARPGPTRRGGRRARTRCRSA